MNRTTYLLIGLLLLLGAATYVVLNRPGEQSTSGTTGELLARYDSAAVDRLEITGPSGSVVLTREAGVWMLTEPLRAPANRAAVSAAVGQGGRIRLNTIVSSNPAKQPLFQVDSSGTLVRVFERGNATSAFRIGKMGSRYTETYVRREGSDDVYLADGMLTWVFNRPTKEWRDKAILETARDSIRTVRFQYGDTLFTLAKPDTAWVVDGIPAAEGPVRTLLGTLTNLQADDFVDTLPGALPDAEAVIEVVGQKLIFARHPDGTKYYVRSSATPQLFEVQVWKAGQVLKRERELIATP